MDQMIDRTGRTRQTVRLALLCGATFLCLTVTRSLRAEDGEKAAPTAPAPTAAEQILSLEAMCAENTEAMAARQTEKPLFDRLGGEKKIHEIVVEIVRLHGENEAIKHVLDGVDQKLLIDGVAQFLVAGSGGPAKYQGRNMVEAHAHLDLTNADFLSAGGDVMQAMKNKGCGEAEIQEVVCVLVGLRSQVVIDSEKTLQ